MGKEFIVDSLEDMCSLMCDNALPEEMNLVAEYEEVGGDKCLTVVDTNKDVAMATFVGEEVDRALEHLINFCWEIKEV